MIFILGISITLNIISAIIFLLIYKFSFRGFKKKIENCLINDFISTSDDNIARNWDWTNFDDLGDVTNDSK